MSNFSDPSEPPLPRPVGRVVRLDPNWDRIFPLLTGLGSAVVYRGSHAMLCQFGSFPETTQIDRYAMRNEGFRGASFRLEHWSEFWFYEESRNDILLPCFEVADFFGRGLVKICFDDPNAGLAALDRLGDFILHESDGWDLLHVRAANTMDCFASRRLRAMPRIATHLRAIFTEAHCRQTELGLLIPGTGLAVWDCFVLRLHSSLCCWLTASHGPDSFHLELAGIHSARIVREAERGVAIFYDEYHEPALTLIEPAGVHLEALDQLKRVLPDTIQPQPPR